jgi:hypothetical protein
MHRLHMALRHIRINHFANRINGEVSDMDRDRMRHQPDTKPELSFAFPLSNSS